MSDLLREATAFVATNKVPGGYVYEVDLIERLAEALAAAAPPPDRNDLLAVGRAQSQHDAGGARSSPATAPSTGRAEPWWGHRFKEFSKGVWTCDCGKTIREVAMSAFRETMMEERIERAFWKFDAERKRTGAERDAFKHQLRHLVRAYVTAANLAHKESAGAPLVCSGCGEALPDGYEDDEPVDCRECGNMETAVRGEPSAAPTPEREARTDERIGDERNGRKENDLLGGQGGRGPEAPATQRQTLGGEPEIVRCWCGEVGTHEQLFDDSNCSGDGECECGGDHLCVCHNHGVCPGCVNCEPEDPDHDEMEP